jgi:hypothetical protein
MHTDLRTEPEQTVTGLVTGIVSDVQDLLQQQLALLRHEIKSDFTRSKEAALSLVLGLGIGGIGVAFVFVMLAWLLHDATAMPLWSCFGLVGAGLSVVGGALYFWGKYKFESFNPLPDETAQAMKENIQCLMNPR